MSTSDIDIAAEIRKQIALLSKKEYAEITEQLPIYGQDGCFDSMGLIELCLRLEDFALELGFEFDWTSDAAMSNSRSIFKDVSSLCHNFLNQKNKI